MDRKLYYSIEKALSKMDNGRLLSGCNDMLDVFRKYQDPLHRIIASYELGAIFWAQIGFGNKAKEYYRNVMDVAETYGISKVEKAYPSMVANACENMMHLSVSYEEYFEWAEKLYLLQPTDDIFRGMVPQIKEIQAKGFPWAQTLETIANQSYNRTDQAREEVSMLVLFRLFS
jgi:hypothetical protein